MTATRIKKASSRHLAFKVIASTLLVFGSFFIAVALVIALVIRVSSWTPAYDDANPEYSSLVNRVSEIRRSQDLGSSNERGIDLSKLNNGDWTTACVFGGFNNPLEDFAAGGNVSAEDRKRLLELATRGNRLAQVEEFELMIAYVDLRHDAHFVHLRDGIGPDGQHFKRCITRPQTVVDLLAYP